MKLSDFDFSIPDELIAQHPPDQRSSSRMLVLHRKSGVIEHRRFLDLPRYLGSSDWLVCNNSKVFKARLIGRRSSGGRVEVFLLKKLDHVRWECLIRATASSKEGLEVYFKNGVKAQVVARRADGMTYEVAFHARDDRIDFWLERLGRMPLPPYIRREAEELDGSRYQTVYAREPGSVAAPTAGLHFTEETLAELRGKGVRIGQLVLHVGLGTFQPIKSEDIEEHRMHMEGFHIDDALLGACMAARRSGERVVAVGTTVVRALESAARGMEGETNLFLRPGDDFKLVDALFTNFHQPKSSLIVMLAAFVGNKELLLDAYRCAVREGYRFFSYGDCMLVI